MPGEFEVRKEISLPADPSAVWDAVASGPGIDSWFMGRHEVDAVAKRVRFRLGELSTEARITAWDPPHRFAYRGPAAEDGTFDAMEFLVEAAEGGTSVLRFMHRGFAADGWEDEYHESFGAGWEMYLHTLGELLRHFRGRYAAYVTADGPASSARPDAWPKLLAALRLPEPATGQEVRFAFGGNEIAGVLDYSTRHYAGIRTSDALYRFHERSLLGMPIAVGHHLFRAVDEPAETAGWRDWLADALS
ncbi:SRPBCC family protein [Amycolatopsis benzoatilytica]|uniref:SRPBCC family protein n=1 Tax=Amycolatopsis benzoatilytica TaxID=346045 RepID=UPI0003797215|nr:SRPBCC domain-containing protein [Amycolatopsis benzoatilytica]